MKKMGQQKSKEAKEDFTFLILVNILVGMIMSVLGFLLMDSIFAGMHLSMEVEGYCVLLCIINYTVTVQSIRKFENIC